MIVVLDQGLQDDLQEAFHIGPGDGAVEVVEQPQRVQGIGLGLQVVEVGADAAQPDATHVVHRQELGVEQLTAIAFDEVGQLAPFAIVSDQLQRGHAQGFAVIAPGRGERLDDRLQGID